MARALYWSRRSSEVRESAFLFVPVKMMILEEEGSLSMMALVLDAKSIKKVELDAVQIHNRIKYILARLFRFLAQIYMLSNSVRGREFHGPNVDLNKLILIIAG
jgi:hypothetical protein